MPASVSSYSLFEGRNFDLDDIIFASFYTPTPMQICEANSGTRQSHGFSELDSHANMVCLGRQAIIINDDGKTCGVTPYDPSLGTKYNIPLRDMAIAYDDEVTGEVIILVFFDALHMPTMDYNLIPPFILREAGLQVHDRPKIHSDTPSNEDHTTFIPVLEQRIIMQLRGTFSVFKTRQPSPSEIIECEKVICTPGTWNPHSESWSANEQALMDEHGDVIEPKHDTEYARLLLEDDGIDDGFDVKATDAAHTETRGPEQQTMNEDEEEHRDTTPFGMNETSAVLGSITNTLDEKCFAQSLEDRCDVREFAVSMGAMTAWTSDYLFDDNGTSGIGITISATYADPPKMIDPEELSKTWNVSVEDVKKTL